MPFLGHIVVDLQSFIIYKDLVKFYPKVKMGNYIHNLTYNSGNILLIINIFQDSLVRVLFIKSMFIYPFYGIKLG